MESLGTRAVVGLGMDAMPPLTLHVVAVAVTSALVTVASVLLAGLAVWGAVGKRVAGEHPPPPVQPPPPPSPVPTDVAAVGAD